MCNFVTSLLIEKSLNIPRLRHNCCQSENVVLCAEIYIFGFVKTTIPSGSIRSFLRTGAIHPSRKLPFRPRWRSAAKINSPAVIVYPVGTREKERGHRWHHALFTFMLFLAGAIRAPGYCFFHFPLKYRRVYGCARCVCYRWIIGKSLNEFPLRDRWTRIRNNLLRVQHERRINTSKWNARKNLRHS